MDIGPGGPIYDRRLEVLYVKIYNGRNYKETDTINRAKKCTNSNSTIKLVISPEDQTINLFGNLVYVSNLNKSLVANKKNFSFSYCVPMDKIIRITLKTNNRKKNKNLTSTLTFKVPVSEGKRLYTDLQMGHNAIEKRFEEVPATKTKKKKKQIQSTTVCIFLDRLPQSDLKNLAKILYRKQKLGRIDFDRPLPLLPMKKNGMIMPLRLSNISKITVLEDLGAAGLSFSYENFIVSFANHKKLIKFYLRCDLKRRKTFQLCRRQLLGIKLTNSNNSSTIHLTVDLTTACEVSSKLSWPADPPTEMLSKMASEFEKANDGSSNAIIRIYFKEMLKEHELKHLKLILPGIGKSLLKCPESESEVENLSLANDESNDQEDDNSLIEMSTGKEEDLSEDLKPLKLDVKRVKIDQHTISYSSAKFSHYINLIVDGDNLRIIGNAQINRDIEEKIYFYFKIPINSSEIDRNYEVHAAPGLKSRIKFSLTSEESNYIRGLFKKSLNFFGIDNEVTFTRLEFILATGLNGLDLNHLKSTIKNLHLITKTEKNHVKIESEVPDQMDLEELFFESEEVHADSTFSTKLDRIYLGENMLYLRKGPDQILNIVINQNNMTIIGDLENPRNRERVEFKFEISISKIENLVVNKKVTCIGVGVEYKTNRDNLYIFPDHAEMEIIRQKLSDLEGCPLDRIRNYLKLSIKSIRFCKRIQQLWQNSRKDGSFQNNVQLFNFEDFVLTCQSIHFGQYVYRGENSILISKRFESTKIGIRLRDFKDEENVQLVIADPKNETEKDFQFQTKYFLSEYDASQNHWILFFIPHPKCQESFASKLKFHQLGNFFDPSSEDKKKSYVRLVFEFPPNLQEREDKIIFVQKMTEIFDTRFYSYLDSRAHKNIEIIKLNLAQDNNENTVMEIS